MQGNTKMKNSKRKRSAPQKTAKPATPITAFFNRVQPTTTVFILFTVFNPQPPLPPIHSNQPNDPKPLHGHPNPLNHPTAASIKTNDTHSFFTHKQCNEPNPDPLILFWCSSQALTLEYKRETKPRKRYHEPLPSS